MAKLPLPLLPPCCGTAGGAGPDPVGCLAIGVPEQPFALKRRQGCSGSAGRVMLLRFGVQWGCGVPVRDPPVPGRLAAGRSLLTGINLLFPDLPAPQRAPDVEETEGG